MFEKSCKVCDKKFKGSDLESIIVNKFGIKSLICHNCLDNHFVRKTGCLSEYVMLCPECNSEMENLVTHKKRKLAFFCNQCKEARTTDEIMEIRKPKLDLSNVTKTINGMSAQIDLYYTEAQMVDTKLFVSKKNRDNFVPVVTKEKQKPILKNRIRLQIELSNPHLMTSWNKPSTGYDVHDDFGNGYSLTIAFSEPDSVLMTSIMPAIRDCGFGPISGKQWTHCHYTHHHPTDEDAAKLLENVTDAITTELQKMVKTP